MLTVELQHKQCHAWAQEGWNTWIVHFLIVRSVADLCIIRPMGHTRPFCCTYAVHVRSIVNWNIDENLFPPSTHYNYAAFILKGCCFIIVSSAWRQAVACLRKDNVWILQCKDMHDRSGSPSVPPNSLSAPCEDLCFSAWMFGFIIGTEKN